eukprot:NODE_262_length_11424_cov_0.885828.p5 type:complete len:313 gc:universal NODE_262_length_11424_cov_0.885828:9321-8383(-)
MNLLFLLIAFTIVLSGEKSQAISLQNTDPGSFSILFQSINILLANNPFRYNESSPNFRIFASKLSPDWQTVILSECAKSNICYLSTELFIIHQMALLNPSLPTQIIPDQVHQFPPNYIDLFFKLRVKLHPFDQSKINPSHFDNEATLIDKDWHLHILKDCINLEMCDKSIAIELIRQIVYKIKNPKLSEWGYLDNMINYVNQITNFKYKLPFIQYIFENTGDLSFYHHIFNGKHVNLNEIKSKILLFCAFDNLCTIAKMMKIIELMNQQYGYSSDFATNLLRYLNDHQNDDALQKAIILVEASLKLNQINII